MSAAFGENETGEATAPRRKQKWRESPSTPTAAEVSALIERTPPASPRAEMSLLGALLIDPSRIPDVVPTIPNGTYFAQAKHAQLYDAITKVYDDTGGADAVEVVELLEGRGQLDDLGGAEYLVELSEGVPTAVNAERYAMMVREKHQLRALIDTAGTILHAAYNAGALEGEGVRNVIDEAERDILKVAEDVSGAEADSLKILLQQQITTLAEAGDSPIMGVDTGFYELNEMTNGLQKGEMTIVAGRPSMGKTAFALNLAEQISLGGATGKKVPVAIFSMEMSSQSVAARMLCAMSGVSSQKVRSNRLNKDDFNRLLNTSDYLQHLPIFIDDTPSLTVMMLRAKARRLKMQHGIGAIVIDYLQLMSAPASAREGRQQEVSVISRGIKALARELELPIICLAQLNRGAEQREGHRPRMADLRESGSIEQDADVIALLHREEYYHIQDPSWAEMNPDKVGLAEVIIAKQRNGPTGTVELAWDNTTTRFKNKAHPSQIRNADSYGSAEDAPFETGPQGNGPGAQGSGYGAPPAQPVIEDDPDIPMV